MSLALNERSGDYRSRRRISLGLLNRGDNAEENDGDESTYKTATLEKSAKKMGAP